MELRFRWCAFSVVYTCAFTVNCSLRFALSDICRQVGDNLATAMRRTVIPVEIHGVLARHHQLVQPSVNQDLCGGYWIHCFNHLICRSPLKNYQLTGCQSAGASCSNLPPVSGQRRRRRPDYFLPLLCTKFSECAFSHAGHAAWNTLPEDIQPVANAADFRILLKSHYCSPFSMFTDLLILLLLFHWLLECFYCHCVIGTVQVVRWYDYIVVWCTKQSFKLPPKSKLCCANQTS